MNSVGKSILFAVLPFGAMCLLQPCHAAPWRQQSSQSPRGTTRKPLETKSHVYVNRQYGFSFSLPTSWKGYSIVVSEWHGTSAYEQDKSAASEKRPDYFDKASPLDRSGPSPGHPDNDIYTRSMEFD